QQATNSCPYDIHAHFAGYRSRKFSCMILLKLRYGACGAQGMDLAAALVKCGSATTRILSRIYSPVTTSVQLASGRWYPQPDYEMSKHRTRPPSMGIHRRTRLNVVDNSALGKEAHTTGKRAYCIDVYKQGRRKKHLPHATLGDKILVAIRGQMRKAYVVGANTHVHYRKHGVPSTDTNNIVLLDEEGNPLGNRITSPIPIKLLEKKDNAQFAKVLALANKFI
uniref:Large ribosomal subunit protein uL14m n=1 Tax=Haemonchus contortus TaxID=6289 RepID=A0A912M2X8_HAECO